MIWADRASLPRFQSWKAAVGGNVDLWDFAAHEGGPTLAVAFAGLFCPRFVRIDDCILLADRYEPEAYHQWREALGTRSDEIERVMNHIHLWDLFDPEKEDLPGAALESLAALLAGTWEWSLVKQFPDRVATAVAAEDYGPTVTIFTRAA